MIAPTFPAALPACRDLNTRGRAGGPIDPRASCAQRTVGTCVRRSRSSSPPRRGPRRQATLKRWTTATRAMKVIVTTSQRSGRCTGRPVAEGFGCVQPTARACPTHSSLLPTPSLSSARHQLSSTHFALPSALQRGAAEARWHCRWRERDRQRPAARTSRSAQDPSGSRRSVLQRLR